MKKKSVNVGAGLKLQALVEEGAGERAEEGAGKRAEEGAGKRAEEGAGKRAEGGAGKRAEGGAGKRCSVGAWAGRKLNGQPSSSNCTAYLALVTTHKCQPVSSQWPLTLSRA